MLFQSPYQIQHLSNAATLKSSQKNEARNTVPASSIEMSIESQTVPQSN
jgi:hypothetical protein